MAAQEQPKRSVGKLEITEAKLVDVHTELGKARVVEAVASYLKEIGADKAGTGFGLTFSLTISC
jgi:hypothetical protein